jgi:uncharacterized membrane protein YheB (UPF0754 family)
LEKSYFVIQLQVQSVNPVLHLESLSEDRQSNDDDESVESVVLSDWIQAQEKELKEQATSPYVVASRLDARIRDSPLTRTSCLVRWFDWLLKMLSKRYREKIESRCLPILIQEQITKKLNDILKAKMVETNVLADTVVLAERDQARYFLDNLL